MLRTLNSQRRILGQLGALGQRLSDPASTQEAITNIITALKSSNQSSCPFQSPSRISARTFSNDESWSQTWDHVRSRYSTINVEVDDEGIAVLTLDRPEALNALNSKMMEEIVSACLYLDRQHPLARVIILTGSGTKAFAAGADIKEMSSQAYTDAYSRNLLCGWDALRSVRKPMIAAVNGYALGGGCELAMMCDIILAADTASFGQPEITLGVIPGMGGTQRLTKAIGKSRAMELVLTGVRISATEAAKIGLVSRAVPGDKLMDEAKKLGGKIASYSCPVVAKAKECVNVAFESSLHEGLRFEKREFWSCFALEDQMEGMSAFMQKRVPEFKNK